MINNDSTQPHAQPLQSLTAADNSVHTCGHHTNSRFLMLSICLLTWHFYITI